MLRLQPLGAEGGDFAGRSPVALVTGASSGIGRAIAHALSNSGYALFLVGTNAERLHEVSRKCSRHAGVRAVAHACDLTRFDDVNACVSRCVAELGGIDLLVNAAGVGDEEMPAYEADLSKWDFTLDVDLVAPMRLTRLALPHILRSGGAGGEAAPWPRAVVFLSSIAGKQPMHKFAAYAAAKHGLLAFSQAVADDIQDTGVKARPRPPRPLDPQNPNIKYQ
eukprot:tig00021569_g22341.t1